MVDDWLTYAYTTNVYGYRSNLFVANLDMLCDVSLDITIRFIQAKQAYITNLEQQSTQDSDDEQMNAYYIENATDCIVWLIDSFSFIGTCSDGYRVLNYHTKRFHCRTYDSVKLLWSGFDQLIFLLIVPGVSDSVFWVPLYLPLNSALTYIVVVSSSIVCVSTKLDEFCHSNI